MPFSILKGAASTCVSHWARKRHMRLQKEGQLGRRAGKLDRATESHKMGTGDVLVSPGAF